MANELCRKCGYDATRVGWPMAECGHERDDTSIYAIYCPKCGTEQWRESGHDILPPVDDEPFTDPKEMYGRTARSSRL